MAKKNILPINIDGIKNVVCVNTHVVNCFLSTVIGQYQLKKLGYIDHVEINRYSLGLCMTPCISQAFARDFASIGDPNAILGAEVVSANDGIVVAVEDGHEPGEIIDEQSKAAGNYIVIKHRFGEYALYGHLLAGSMKVDVGQKVSRGQVIAAVGNTGNSSAPHLHFQLTYNDPRTLGFFGGIAKRLENFEPYISSPLTWKDVDKNGGYVRVNEFKKNESGKINEIEFLS